jgi:hypothetical protein
MANTHTHSSEPKATTRRQYTRAPRPRATVAVEAAQRNLAEDDAAMYTGLTVSRLRASRLDPPRCDGPPFVRIGRQVRYLVDDLDAWLAARRVVPAVRPLGGAR